jgi:hypothetical protein
MVDGGLTSTSASSAITWSPGDGIHFASSLLHCYVNASDQTARAVTTILWEDTEPTGEHGEEEA